ncbi:MULTISPECIES: chorismate mutase [Nocardiaceae]|uniref:Chorismate mutase n=1 Tax=Rhodococcoides corynebacterioides TaxID=53972 RepID=A0ABS2KNB9_9NOCA|nr:MULTISPECIES: chorismate mutase [Rhodococcus]MBM7413468.1 chorismate mutase [Rhodococcus corynebacterioides]MBP1115931.1 chorismate mutase [Rhodococcus sp. PvP016]
MSIATDFATADVTRNHGADTAHDIDSLHDEIERLDAQILAAVARRTELTRTVGMMEPRSAASSAREMSVLQHFGDLGREGRTLGMLLLRMGRGQIAR